VNNLDEQLAEAIVQHSCKPAHLTSAIISLRLLAEDSHERLSSNTILYVPGVDARKVKI
jgi:hypothetical protein